MQVTDENHSQTPQTISDELAALMPSHLAEEVSSEDMDKAAAECPNGVGKAGKDYFLQLRVYGMKKDTTFMGVDFFGCGTLVYQAGVRRASCARVHG